MIGKKVRLEKIFKSNKTVLVPLDHGVTLGPIKGLDAIYDLIESLDKTEVNGIIVHKGIAESFLNRGYILKKLEFIIHLSASTLLSASDVNYKQLACSVEEAVRLGALGVSIQLNLGTENEGEMLKDLGDISKKCNLWGMPLLVMAYYRGPKIDDEKIAHVARVAWELGADIVKVNYTNDIISFKQLVESVKIPIIIAGGEKVNSISKLLKVIEDSLKVGGSGVCIGRNIFEFENPCLLSNVITHMVNDNMPAEEAMRMLNNNMCNQQVAASTLINN